MLIGLSYPHMAPPIDWLMVQLLFYDEIKTIVPASEIDSLPDLHRRFYDETSNAVTFVNPENEGIWASTEEKKRLVKGLEFIKKKSSFNSEQLKIVIPKDGSHMRIDECCFLHVSKTAPEILKALERLGLMPSESAKIAEAFVNEEKWLIVEENSADLLLGHLSNNISKKHGYSPLTYRNVPFIVNSLNDMDVSLEMDSQTVLASAIINLELPYNISSMEISAYKSLRNAYADIRLPLHDLVNNLSSIYRLNRIGNPNDLIAMIDDIVSNFDEEYMKFKKTRFVRKVRSWGPCMASSILTLVSSAAIPFPLNLVLAGGSITVAAVDKVLSSGKMPSNGQLFNRLSKLEAEVLKKADIQSLL